MFIQIVQLGPSEPQGSILEPLLHTIFTNELPEMIHNHAQAQPNGPAVHQHND